MLLKGENKMQGKIEALERTIHYEFKDKSILRQALTHSSYANEHRNGKWTHNERIEFLGDAVLEVVVSEYLFHNYPKENEGQMTKIRSSLVCEFTLSQCARDIQLGNYLYLSKGEALTGGRERNSILCDAFESIIGALYLDGGFEPAKAFIYQYLLKDVEDKTLFYDAKTILQEMVQGNNWGSLSYELLEEKGPDHNKEFIVQAMVGERVLGKGIGRTKKAAEQQAAYGAIKKLKSEQV